MDYTEKLQALKKEIQSSKDTGATLGGCVDSEELKEMIRRFCSPDDACFIKHEDLYMVFDEYCKENNYPIINRRTLGRHFCSALGLARKKASKNGKLCWIYVKKPV